MKAFNSAVFYISATLVALVAAPKAIAITLLAYFQNIPGQFGDGTGVDLEKLRSEVQSALGQLGVDIKAFCQKAIDEANKRNGDLSAETKEKVDKLLVASGEITARLHEVEQKQDRIGAEEKPKFQTLGQIVVSSDEFKAFIAAGGIRAQNTAFVMKAPKAATMLSTDTTNTTTVGVPPDIVPGVFPGTQRRLTIRDMIAPGTTSSNLVQYVKESGFTNNADVVSEGDGKPKSALTYELVQSPVTTIAHYFKASKQILDDFSGLQSQIDQRGRYGIKLVEENQLLKGSGVGNNLDGIYTQATAYSAPFMLPAGFSKIDVLRLMILQAELAEYPPDAIVLHPSDWAAIELTKTTDKAYIFANPQNMAMPRLWGLPVVATQAMTIDTALVGAFRLGAQVFDREEVNVVIATMNEDDFIRNLITIRVEERLALAVYRPEAFIANTNLPAS